MALKSAAYTQSQFSDILVIIIEHSSIIHIIFTLVNRSYLRASVEPVLFILSAQEDCDF